MIADGAQLTSGKAFDTIRAITPLILLSLISHFGNKGQPETQEDGSPCIGEAG
jgi:hypothetical protein